jgi:hypothetical protein
MSSHMINKIALFLLLLFLTGCAHPLIRTDSFCLNASYIIPTPHDVDVMSERLVTQIYRHDRIYKLLCAEDK